MGSLVLYVQILVILLVYDSTVNACQVCPDTWTIFQGSCYMFEDELKLNWSEAEHHCASNNSHLVTLETREEDLFVQGYARRLFKNIADELKTNSFWMGAKDDEIEGKWLWYTDRSELSKTYSNWRPGEPNDYRHNEDCLELFGQKYFNFRWADGLCADKYHFICEMEIDEDTSTIIG